MAVFRYRPYYRYDGPTHSNPLLERLSEEDSLRNLQLLAEDLESHFSEIGGKVYFSDDGVVSITTDLPPERCHEIVAGYLTNLNLLADKVADE